MPNCLQVESKSTYLLFSCRTIELEETMIAQAHGLRLDLRVDDDRMPASVSCYVHACMQQKQARSTVLSGEWWTTGPRRQGWALPLAPAA